MNAINSTECSNYRMFSGNYRIYANILSNQFAFGRAAVPKCVWFPTAIECVTHTVFTVITKKKHCVLTPTDDDERTFTSVQSMSAYPRKEAPFRKFIVRVRHIIFVLSAKHQFNIWIQSFFYFSVFRFFRSISVFPFGSNSAAW